MNLNKELRSNIRDIVDFPKPGIVFKDITPILKKPELFRATLDIMGEKVTELKPAYICGIESRGFIFGAALAADLGIGFIPIRKPGKLPYKTYSRSYELEYGTNTLEIHTDAIYKNSNVVIIDDLLATGGTAKAAAELVEDCGGVVLQILFVIELSFLNGRNSLQKYKVDSLVCY